VRQESPIHKICTSSGRCCLGTSIGRVLSGHRSQSSEIRARVQITLMCDATLDPRHSGIYCAPARAHHHSRAVRSGYSAPGSSGAAVGPGGAGWTRSGGCAVDVIAPSLACRRWVLARQLRPACDTLERWSRDVEASHRRAPADNHVCATSRVASKPLRGRPTGAPTRSSASAGYVEHHARWSPCSSRSVLMVGIVGRVYSVVNSAMTMSSMAIMLSGFYLARR